jgi:hypothetical protein
MMRCACRARCTCSCDVLQCFCIIVCWRFGGCYSIVIATMQRSCCACFQHHWCCSSHLEEFAIRISFVLGLIQLSRVVHASKSSRMLADGTTA